MASASRKGTRRQRKLELYSNYLIPIHLGFLIPLVIGMLRENAANRMHEELTREHAGPSARPIRNLRGEEQKRMGTGVTQRKKRRVRRSL